MKAVQFADRHIHVGPTGQQPYKRKTTKATISSRNT